jgi:hypothetical protein
MNIDKSQGISQNKFTALDSSGKTCDAINAVSPVVTAKPDGSEIEFIGTCFFAYIHGVIISAAHVLKSAITDGECTKALGVMHIFDGKYMFRTVKKAFWTGTDIAIAYLDQPAHTTSGEILKNKVLKVKESIPKKGDRIFTYAFPRTTINIDAKVIKISSGYYEGTVTGVFANGRDKSMLPGPCIQTDMYIHGGASGGPVFDEGGSVIGINSSSYQDSPNISFVSLLSPIMDVQLDGIVVQGKKETMTFRKFLARSGQ